tara:strand:- start:985 stop:1113 length:129 start_codon:yes stop_codon:yes gene_type:complete
MISPVVASVRHGMRLSGIGSLYYIKKKGAIYAPFLKFHMKPF